MSDILLELPDLAMAEDSNIPYPPFGKYKLIPSLNKASARVCYRFCGAINTVEVSEFYIITNSISVARQKTETAKLAIAASDHNKDCEIPPNRMDN